MMCRMARKMEAKKRKQHLHVAEAFLRAMRQPGEGYRVIGILDDSPARVGRNIHGIPVLGTRDDLGQVVERLRKQGRRPRRLHSPKPFSRA